MHSWWRAKYLPRAANIRKVFFKLKSWNLPFHKCHPVVLAWLCIAIQSKNIFSLLDDCFLRYQFSSHVSPGPYLPKALQLFPELLEFSTPFQPGPALLNVLICQCPFSMFLTLKKKKSIPINGYSNWDFKPSFCCISSHGVLEKHILTTWFR